MLTLKDQSILADGDINEGKAFFVHLCPFPSIPPFCYSIFWSRYAEVDVTFCIIEMDMLENVEIGEQKQRDEAYKAAKKKTGIYVDK